MDSSKGPEAAQGWGTVLVVTVIILKKGCNIHKSFTVKKLPYKVKVENQEYEITIEGLWKVRRRFYKRPWDYFMGRKGHFICLFRDKNKAPLERQDSRVTPMILRNVKRSRILTKALNEIFRKGFEGIGRILFILFVIIAVGCAIAYLQGWIG